MSEIPQRGLQRLGVDDNLPVGFNQLSEEEQLIVRKKLLDQDIEIRGEILRKGAQSRIAENDISVGIDAVQRLDHERKIYSKHMKGETGSGSYELHIRGGDTKFIIPVLAVIGAIVLGLICIMALK
jgi:hypothetical protein